MQQVLDIFDQFVKAPDKLPSVSKKRQRNEIGSEYMQEDSESLSVKFVDDIPSNLADFEEAEA
jgi:hypothetical protein